MPPVQLQKGNDTGRKRQCEVQDSRSCSFTRLLLSWTKSSRLVLFPPSLFPLACTLQWRGLPASGYPGIPTSHSWHLLTTPSAPDPYLPTSIDSSSTTSGAPEIIIVTCLRVKEWREDLRRKTLKTEVGKKKKKAQGCKVWDCRL